MLLSGQRARTLSLNQENTCSCSGGVPASCTEQNHLSSLCSNFTLLSAGCHMSLPYRLYSNAERCMCSFSVATQSSVLVALASSSIRATVYSFNPLIPTHAAGTPSRQQRHWKGLHTCISHLHQLLLLQHRSCIVL